MSGSCVNPPPRNPLQPFSAAVRFVFALLVVFTIAGIGFMAFGNRTSFLGVGDTSVCVTPELRFGGTDFEKGLAPFKEMIEPGAGVMVKNLSICDHTPSAMRRALSSLTQAPEFVLYFAVFFLFFRLVRAAESDGPFSPLVAARLRTVGWTLIIGGYLAHAVQDAAETALENTFAVPGSMMDDGNGMVLADGLLTLPLPDLLTGLGLLTIARIMKVGAQMHDDLAGTI